ncbi:MAG: MotA/TolQ/ExbB proton channel family protein [Vampirovibrionales bacterium]|nr:MotA/TolQ/ExbB proton channel family protein [Vampirovibrionales bacterium]
MDAVNTNLIWFTIQNDWHVLTPIVLASLGTLYVFFDRLFFYNQNKRDVVQFVTRLQRELQRGSLDTAQVISAQLGGVIGEVSEEGLRILSEQRDNFSRAFDITTSLATRKLEKNLSILGTIGTIAPYLGLFGTVVRILLTFGELSKASGSTNAPEIMFGIGSALIATAFGLGVAILAVTFNNYFRSIVARYEDDFQLLKLLFLSVFPAEGQPEATATQMNSNPGIYGNRPTAPAGYTAGIQGVELPHAPATGSSITDRYR